MSLTPISIPITLSHSIDIALSSCRRDQPLIIYHFPASPARDVRTDISCFDGIAHHRRRRQELHRIYTSSASLRNWGALVEEAGINILVAKYHSNSTIHIKYHVECTRSRRRSIMKGAYPYCQCSPPTPLSSNCVTQWNTHTHNRPRFIIGDTLFIGILTANRNKRHDFPTPLSPIRTSLNR